MGKLWTTFRKDIKLSFNGIYFYIEIGMALIFILIIVFVVPENFESNQTFHVVLDMDESLHSGLGDLFGGEGEHITFHDSRDSMVVAMEADRSSVGVVLSLVGDSLAYDMVLQGYESERMKTLLKTAIEGQVLTRMPGHESAIGSRILEPGGQKLNDRLNVLPIYLTMNVALMGLFIIAAYIFLDKDEGVIKAFAVAPVHIWQYLASKVFIMAILGLGTSLVTVLVVVGLEFNIGVFILLVLAFNFFGSALGLLISSYFDTMVKAMGALYLAIMIMMIASVSYFMPSFNPLWIRVFPSYPMFFSFREVFLADGDLGYVGMNIGIYLVASGILFVWATARFKRNLTV